MTRQSFYVISVGFSLASDLRLIQLAEGKNESKGKGEPKESSGNSKNKSDGSSLASVDYELAKLNINCEAPGRYQMVIIWQLVDFARLES